MYITGTPILFLNLFVNPYKELLDIFTFTYARQPFHHYIYISFTLSFDAELRKAVDRFTRLHIDGRPDGRALCSARRYPTPRDRARDTRAYLPYLRDYAYTHLSTT